MVRGSCSIPRRPPTRPWALHAEARRWCAHSIEAGTIGAMSAGSAPMGISRGHVNHVPMCRKGTKAA